MTSARLNTSHIVDACNKQLDTLRPALPDPSSPKLSPEEKKLLERFEHVMMIRAFADAALKENQEHMSVSLSDFKYFGVHW